MISVRRFLGLFSVVAICLVVLLGCARSPEEKRVRHLEAGKRLFDQKQYARAILEFKNATQAVPKHAEAYYQLGMAYGMAGDIRMSVGALRKAVELDPKHVAAQLRLGQLMAATIDKKILANAEDQLRAVLELEPSNPDALNALALTELKLGQTEEAVERLQQVLASRPDNLGAAMMLAQTRLALKDPKSAEAVLRAVCDKAPKSADAWTLLGRFYRSQNRIPEAEEQFRKAIQINASAGPALMELARLLQAQGRKQEAEEMFKRISALPEKLYRPVYAIFLFEDGRRDEAIRQFEGLAKADPEDRDARTRLVVAYQSVGRHSEAETVLNAALKKNPKDLDALLQRGELLMRAGKYGQSEADLNTVLKHRPNSPEVHYVLSKLHQLRQSPLLRKQELAEALKLNPYLLAVRLEFSQVLLESNAAKTALQILNETPDVQRSSLLVIAQRNWALWSTGDLTALRAGIDEGLAKQRFPDLLIQDGLLKLRQGNSAGARAALEEALKINPQDIRALAALRQSYVAQKQGSMAVQKVKEYAAQAPKSAAVQQFLGNILLASGEQMQARTAFAAAKEVDPSFVPAYLSLAQLDAAAGKWNDARERLKSVLAVDKSNATARLWMGNIEEVHGNHTTAIQYYREALETDARNSMALNNLAWILAEHGGKGDEALKYAEKATELAPQSAANADTLGWILYHKGLYSRAVKHLEYAVSTGVNDRDAVIFQYHLAMGYAKAGDPKRGRGLMEKALKINPNLPEAKMAQEVLRH